MPQFNRKLLTVAVAASILSLGAVAASAQQQTTAPLQLAQAAATGTIQGRVFAADTKANLVGATVSIPELNLSTVTDSQGRYILRRVPQGEHQVRVRYSQRSIEDQTVAVSADQATSLDFDLDRTQEVGLEEVVVYGRLIADSEAQALSRQQANNNVTNIIASDSIGRFPDHNAAEALGRVPGISIERDQGEARFVNVRGAPAEFSNVAFNGVAAPTPSQGGRAARFDTISNDVIKSIEIVKAVTPDIPADSIGGFINVETQGPFDRPGFNMDVGVSQGINELGGGPIQQYQGTVSNTFADDTVGVLVSASRFSTNRLVDNVEGQFFPADDGEIWPRGIDWRNYRGERQNNSLNVRLDWRPMDNMEVYANYVYSEFTDFEIRDRHTYDMDDSHFGHIRSRTGYDPSISNPVTGTILGVNVDGDFNIRTDVESIMSTQFGGDLTLPNTTISWVGGINRSESTRGRDGAYWDFDIPRYRPTSATDPTPRDPSVSMTYDRTNPDFPNVQIFETEVNPDGTLGLGTRLTGLPSDYFQFEEFDIIEREGIVDERYLNIDVEHSWTLFGVASDLKFGTRLSQREATLRRTEIRVDGSQVDGLGLDTSYASILSRRTPGINFPQPAMLEVSQSLSNAQRDAFINTARDNGRLWTRDTLYNDFYNVDENNYALYAMNTFNFDKFNIIAGVRAEYTQMTGEGLEPRNQGAIRDITRAGEREIVLDDLLSARDANGNAIIDQVSGKQSYLDFFPALHINYRPNEDMVFRAAYTESILRPSYGQFAPNRVLSEDSDRGPGGIAFISGGNPELKPYYSKNIDIYAEYYLPYRGILSGGIFYKKIDNPIFSGLQSVDGAPYGLPGVEVRLAGPANGSDGEIRGFELNYSQQFGFLPEPFDGLGASINYTYSEDSATTPPLFNEATGRNDGFSRGTGLTGASRRTYNASIFYENYGVSTRLNYQYRSPWLNVIDLQEPRMDRFWDARPQLDYSFRYSINENWLILLDANNLTDERGRRYNGQRDRVYELEGFGRSYTAGVRWSY